MATTAKRFILLVPLVLLLAIMPAQAQIGFVAGYGADIFSSPGFSGSNSSEFESSGSVNLGVFYDFRLGRVTVRPGLFIRQVNFDWTLSQLDAPFNPISEDLRVAEFPIDFLIHFPLESFNPYVVLGPSFNFLHTDQPDLRQSLDRERGSTSFTSFNIGAGIRLAPEGWGVVLFPEIRYGLALNGFLSEEYIVRTATYSADAAEKISNFSFRVALSLPNY